MNIAWVAPDIPYPLNRGANIAIYNRIFEMHRRGHRIQLFTFATPDEAEMAGLEALRDVCERGAVYPKLGTWRALVKFCITRTTPLRALGRRRAKEFTWRRCAEEHLAVYREVLNR